MNDNVTRPLPARLRELAGRLAGADAEVVDFAADELEEMDRTITEYGDQIATTMAHIAGLRRT